MSNFVLEDVYLSILDFVLTRDRLVLRSSVRGLSTNNETSICVPKDIPNPAATLVPTPTSPCYSPEAPFFQRLRPMLHQYHIDSRAPQLVALSNWDPRHRRGTFDRNFDGRLFHPDDGNFDGRVRWMEYGMETEERRMGGGKGRLRGLNSLHS